MKRSEKAERIVAMLEELYPETPVPLDHQNDFQLLVAVLMSAQTTDIKVNQVTPALFAKAPTPDTSPLCLPANRSFYDRKTSPRRVKKHALQPYGLSEGRGDLRARVVIQRVPSGIQLIAQIGHDLRKTVA